MSTFGDLFKNKRVATGKSLREFCALYGLDPGNVSKVERGLMPPPKDIDKLKEYARILGISEGGDLWHEFMDRACAESGNIPKDILDDKEVVDKLPVFFRLLRGKQVDDEKLKGLIDKIKRA